MHSPYPVIDRRDRAVQIWLIAVAVLVFGIVIVGGATRLTESGLSIVEWRPVMGTLPPLNDHDWTEAFEAYKKIPQYAQLNAGMTLAAFKTIFWWEWTHRLLGRLIGAVFLLPFLFFLWRGYVQPALRPRLWMIFILGGLQGAVGWWMVASGLVDRINVSQYRLAFHLTVAAVIYTLLIWTAAEIGGWRRRFAGAETHGRLAVFLVFLCLLQIYLGALVAGLRAGLVYNSWPDMNGMWIPPLAELFFETPWWRNFFENTLTVQFVHRCVAYLLVAATLVHAWRMTRSGPRLPARWALALAAAALVQMTLGILTLLSMVEISLALTHQAMAFITLAIATLHAAQFAAMPQTVSAS